jgi:hypothetical protein
MPEDGKDEKRRLAMFNKGEDQLSSERFFPEEEASPIHRPGRIACSTWGSVCSTSLRFVALSA